MTGKKQGSEEHSMISSNFLLFLLRLTVCSHVAREHDWWPCYYCLEPLPAKNTLAVSFRVG